MRSFKAHVFGYFVIILLVIATFPWNRTAAWAIGLFGTVLYQVVTLVYIGLRDPAGKFPNASFRQRIAKVLTFERGKSR